MKTAEGLALYAEKVFDDKSPYAMTGYGQRLRDIYGRLAASTYYTVKNPEGFKKLTEIYNSGANPQVFDCHGIVDGYNMTGDDGVLRPVPGIDIQANTDFYTAKNNGVENVDWGKISVPLENNRGYGYWKDGHFGVGVGDGLVIDIWNTGYPARKRPYTQGSWTHWCKCAGIVYGGSKMNELKSGSPYREDVKVLQAKLNSLGYSLVVDGGFGPKTLEAVIDFQKKCGLNADGVVGSQTWAAIESALKPPTQPSIIDYQSVANEANKQIDALVATIEAYKVQLGQKTNALTVIRDTAQGNI